MKKLKIIPLLLALFLLVCSCSKSVPEVKVNSDEWKTNYTFVFCHGLSGWGSYDKQNKYLPYWGMRTGDLIEYLNEQGFNCVSASVAPHGSAWDRACELYAQLTGSVVDYGKEHSERCSHARYGTDYSSNPLIDKWDSENKINLLGHSFGGATVRLMCELMANGSEAEIKATDENDISPLFTGGKADYINSITALASPHNGTT
ncbi:MAG: lipase, partial [Ruminococcaceae bacterium]|nr:lipase [Oscillospiraceae bacterium]